MANLSLHLFVLALMIACLAGVIKGIVGFAMPTVLISGLSNVVPPDVALAGLILPTLVTNGMQVLRFGGILIAEVISRFRVFLGVGGVMLMTAAQWVPNVPQDRLLLMIGLPVTGFALFQLMGGLKTQRAQSFTLDSVAGAITGAIGGVSGIWGPPTVTYLNAIGTPKDKHILAQGVIYGLGAVLLALAHVRSGILSAQTVPFSISLIPAAMIGMWLGTQVSHRFDQSMFRRATLVVLIFSGLNLIRKGVMG